MSMGMIPDETAARYNNVPPIAPKPEDSPDMTVVTDGGKTPAVNLSISTIGIGGTGEHIHIDKQLQQSMNPTLVPPIGINIAPRGPLPQGQPGEEPFGSFEQIIQSFLEGSTDNMTSTIHKFQKTILEEAMADLPEDIKLLLKIAMDDPDGAKASGDSESYSGLYGLGGLKGKEQVEAEEALDNAKQNYTEMDPGKQAEFRYAGSFMAAIAKVLALVSFIKGLMSNSEAEITKEQQMRDIQDMKESLEVAKKEIEKREKLREEIKSSGLLSFLPDSLKIAIGVALLVLAALTVVLAILLLPIASTVLLATAALALGGIALTCDGAGASLEREIGKMACGMFGVDGDNAEWVGYITCAIVLGGFLNPYTYYAIGEGIAAKNKLDYEKAKDEAEADRMTAQGEIAGMKDEANRKMAAIQSANMSLLGANEKNGDDMMAFMAAIMALLAILMMMMALMHGKGAAGCPGGGKGGGAQRLGGKGGSTGAETPDGQGMETAGTPGPTQATPMEGDGLGMSPMGGPPAPIFQEGMPQEASQPNAPTQPTANAPSQEKPALGAASDAQPTSDTAPISNIEVPKQPDLPFGTGGLFINGKPIPDLSVAMNDHPALSNRGNTYQPGQFSETGLWTPPPAGGESAEKLLETVDKELSKLQAFVIQYKQDAQDKTQSDPQAIIDAFQPLIVTLMTLMNPNYGVGDPTQKINEIIFKAVFEAISFVDPSYSDPTKQEILWQALESTQLDQEQKLDTAWNSVEMSESEHQESVLKVTSTSA